jgi:hypothetical protein
MLSTADLARDLRHALDPVRFAAEALGFQPDGWQAEQLRSRARWTLVLCCRQAGKSTTAALLALHTALFRPRSLILLVSPSLRQSSELARKCSDFRARLDPAPALDQNNVLSTAFANGSRIISLPGDEQTTRGYSAPALVLVDEAARVPDDLIRAVRPMLATNPAGRLLALSTPFGCRGWFHEAWDQGGDEWHRVMVAAEHIPRIPPEFLAAERRALGDTWFRQEYQCSFEASSDQVFRPEDIARAISAEVAPLFAKAPAQGDPVPLFPGACA